MGESELDAVWQQEEDQSVFAGIWQICASSAIGAVRYLPERGVLQVRFAEGSMTYDYPCTDALFAQFQRAASKGRFVNEVLKPYAKQRGWSVVPYRWVA